MNATTDAFLTDALFKPLQLGRIQLANRMAMAPLTRNRAADGNLRPTWPPTTTASAPAWA